MLYTRHRDERNETSQYDICLFRRILGELMINSIITSIYIVYPHYGSFSDFDTYWLLWVFGAHLSVTVILTFPSGSMGIRCKKLRLKKHGVFQIPFYIINMRVFATSIMLNCGRIFEMTIAMLSSISKILTSSSSE